MGDGFLVISREQVNALIDRLADPANLAGCVDEVRRMVDIKKTLAWRADLGSWGGGGCAIREVAMSIEGEIELLQSALSALEGGDIAKGINLLREYAGVLPEGLI